MMLDGWDRLKKTVANSAAKFTRKHGPEYESIQIQEDRRNNHPVSIGIALRDTSNNEKFDKTQRPSKTTQKLISILSISIFLIFSSSLITTADNGECLLDMIAAVIFALSHLSGLVGIMRTSLPMLIFFLCQCGAIFTIGLYFFISEAAMMHFEWCNGSSTEITKFSHICPFRATILVMTTILVNIGVLFFYHAIRCAWQMRLNISSQNQTVNEDEV